ncbi:Oligosaccharide biosynthesis protein Alg14 like protein, partial [Halobacillus sp. BAB-2008]
FILIFLKNIFKSFKIIFRERPNVIITTGAGAIVPLCFISKLFKCKVIFIESFAKVNSPTITGKLLNMFGVSNRTYVQSEELLQYYEKAIFKGTLY